jgi:Nif-specific regulatory protein
MLSEPSYKSARSGREFSLLHSISEILSSSLNIKDTLKKIYELLDDLIDIQHGVLTLIDPYTDDLHLEMSHGLTDEEMKIKSTTIEGGIEKSVLDSLTPLFVHDLLDAPQKVKNVIPKQYPTPTSFICLPIVLGKKKLGTISAAFPQKDESIFSQNFKLLSFIALMVAQEIQLTRLMESEKDKLKKENILLRDELKEKYNIHNMIGTSSSMHHVYENIIQVAASNATVLIRGESGTGKELVANAIHYNSPRNNGPLIKINCSAIPESLIESELFGYEKGAFTDAQETKIGKFETAQGGTLFLDEIGEIPLTLQAKLLRVLQEKEIERVGGIKPIKINVRIITATNRDLEKEVKERTFREDLYYRLNVFPIFIPPLRERKADVILLTEHFLSKYAKENTKSIKRISSMALQLLNSHQWPGNVRELENCIERAVILCNSDTIQATHLPKSMQTVETSSLSEKENLSLEDLVNNFERNIIINSLQDSEFNQSKTAASLKTTIRIIGYKIKKLNINLKNLKI